MCYVEFRIMGNDGPFYTVDLPYAPSFAKGDTINIDARIAKGYEHVWKPEVEKHGLFNVARIVQRFKQEFSADVVGSRLTHMIIVTLIPTNKE